MIPSVQLFVMNNSSTIEEGGIPWPFRMNMVGWFEIPATDMARAKSFYQVALGLKFEDHSMGALEMAWFPVSETAIGAPGSIVKGEGYNTLADGVLIYFSTLDLDHAVQRVQDTVGNTIGRHCRK